MKMIIICSLLLLVTARSFSQQINGIQPVTRQDYLKKSKNQKKAAIVLLAGGAALIGTGIWIFSGESFDTGDIFNYNQKAKAGSEWGTGIPIAGVGLLSTIGSIPFFIASGRNKRKSMKVSTSLRIEKTQIIRQNGISFSSFRAISVSINL